METNQYIGNVRLSLIDYYHKTATCGRLLGNQNIKGKGLGTESLKLLAKFSFQKLKLIRIFSSVVELNIASIKSNISAGAKIEGVSRNSFYDGKKHLNSINFSIIKSDFKNI